MILFYTCNYMVTMELKLILHDHNYILFIRYIVYMKFINRKSVAIYYFSHWRLNLQWNKMAYATISDVAILKYISDTLFNKIESKSRIVFINSEKGLLLLIIFKATQFTKWFESETNEDIYMLTSFYFLILTVASFLHNLYLFE